MDCSFRGGQETANRIISAIAKHTSTIRRLSKGVAIGTIEFITATICHVFGKNGFRKRTMEKYV